MKFSRHQVLFRLPLSCRCPQCLSFHYYCLAYVFGLAYVLGLAYALGLAMLLGHRCSLLFPFALGSVLRFAFLHLRFCILPLALCVSPFAFSLVLRGRARVVHACVIQGFGCGAHCTSGSALARTVLVRHFLGLNGLAFGIMPHWILG